MSGAITGELVGAQSGLGYLMTSASGQMDTPLVFAVLVTVSVIAMVLLIMIEMRRIESTDHLIRKIFNGS